MQVLSIYMWNGWQKKMPELPIYGSDWITINSELAAHDEQHKAELAEASHEYDAKLAAINMEHKETLAQKDKWIHRLFIVALVFIVFLIGLMVFDLLNPHMGYFIRETLEAMQ